MLLFFPFATDRRLKHLPWITIALIVVNVLMYLASLPLQPNIWLALGFRLDSHAWYTWFTSMFLHGDLLFHLGGNMYFLWLFGSVLEDALGWWRYLLVYFLGGLTASLLHGLVTLAFMRTQVAVPAIGASGAIAAVVGLFMVRFYKNNVKIAWFVWFLTYMRWGVFEVTSVAAVVLWFLREVADGLMAIGGMASSTANWAHIGGMLFGAAVGLAFGFSKSADIDDLADQAVIYAHGNAPGVAALKYAELAKKVPDDPAILVEKARVTLMSDADPAVAATDFARAVELYVKRGEKGAAILAFSTLGPLFMGRGQAIDEKTLLVLGAAAEGQGALPLAEEVYRAIGSQSPDCREAEKAAFRLPHVMLLQGSPERATEAWRAFVARYPASEWIQYADGRLRA